MSGPDGKQLAPTPDATAMKISATIAAAQVMAREKEQTTGPKKSAGSTRLVETSRRQRPWITTEDVTTSPPQPLTLSPTTTTKVPSLSSNTSMLAAAARNVATNDASGGSGGNALSASTAYAEAVALLRTGVGASSLTLQKSPAVREALRSACFDLACTARAHLLHAREQAPRLPPAAHAALLPATAVGRFLDRLEAQNFDPFIQGKGLGPWVDDRVGAPLRLHGDLLWKTLRNEY